MWFRQNSEFWVLMSICDTDDTHTLDGCVDGTESCKKEETIYLFLIT